MVMMFDLKAIVPVAIIDLIRRMVVLHLVSSIIYMQPIRSNTLISFSMFKI